MAYLHEADFYYGAILSALTNNGICPALIESGDDRQIYEFTTNDASFILYVKYRSNPNSTVSGDHNSWQFNFSPRDRSLLNDYMSLRDNVSLVLVCGKEQLNASEYVVLHKDEIDEILSAGRTAITLSRKDGKKAYRIMRGDNIRSHALKIKANRLY